jgi:hypothetical protein
MAQQQILQSGLQQTSHSEDMEEVAQAPVQQFLQMRLEQGELACSEIHPSFFTKKGTIIQIVNSNCTGSTSIIGGIRLGLSEIEKIPAYVDRNRERIKHVAVTMLDRHLKAHQCATGLGEILTLEDYGLSFSISTLSQKGQGYNPTKRVEAPLFYCMCPGLLDPAYLGHNPDGTPDYAHIVNAFIYLLPATQRRIALLRKQDREAAEALASIPMMSPAILINANQVKRPRQAPGNQANGDNSNKGPRNSGTWEAAANQVHATMQANRIAHLEQELKTARSRALPNPPLPPPGAPPLWRQGGQVDLPDDL